MAKTNINWVSMTDEGIINHIGTFVKNKRVEKNITQAILAKKAGINRYTISKFENGDSITLQVLIQILRALDLLYILNGLDSTEQISPLEAVKLTKKKRQRATGTKENKKPQSDW